MIIWIKYRWFDYSRDINLVTGLITVRDVFRRKIDRREVEQFKGRGVWWSFSASLLLALIAAPHVRKDFPRKDMLCSLRLLRSFDRRFEMNDAMKYGKRRIIRHINACGFVIFPSVKKFQKENTEIRKKFIKISYNISRLNPSHQPIFPRPFRSPN